MRLSVLLSGLVADAVLAPWAAIEVAGISADSRRVEPGFVFVALAGAKTDGARFVDDAISRGAVAIVVPQGVVLAGLSVPTVPTPEPRRLLAIAAARLHQPFPGTVVAITGTSGKTSIAGFTQQIWVAGGKVGASVGTIGIVTPTYATYGSLTTPDPVDLAMSFHRLAGEGVTHVAIEASSHGLDQHRLDGLSLAAGAFSNLSRDHLDYHADIEAYFAAKMRLFDELLPDGAAAVIDVDSEWGERAAVHARARGLDLVSVGRSGTGLRIVSATPDGHGQSLVVDAGSGPRSLLLPLIGTFQISNALIAAGLAIRTGLDPDVALAALERLKGAPGRLELVGTTASAAPVFVDYSHKPDALEKAIAALRPFTRGRLVVVFGCGGDRDRGKRPVMGEIATRLADVVIVTDDNPRSEDPAAIRRQVLAAAPGALEIGDRAEAIRQGVMMLQPGDSLMIAGKGHETGQIVGDRVLPFSDHESALAAIEETRR